jgi:hypothetical protein
LCFIQWSRDLLRWILVLLNIAIELKKNLVYYNNSVKGKKINKKQVCFDRTWRDYFSLKFDCEKLAQEKIEVHRQYVMVNKQILFLENSLHFLVLW